MKRTTVKLPDELDARLRKEAERREVTLSTLVRMAIEQLLGVRPRRRLRYVASAESGRSDTSRRVEEILLEAARAGSLDAGERQSQRGA